MNEPIKVKATFKSIAKKKDTTLQFELAASSECMVPELFRLADSVVFMTISSEQLPLPIEDVEEESDELEDEQDQLPIDDVTEGEQEETEQEEAGEDDPEHDDYYPDEPFTGEDGEL